MVNIIIAPDGDWVWESNKETSELWRGSLEGLATIDIDDVDSYVMLTREQRQAVDEAIKLERHKHLFLD